MFSSLLVVTFSACLVLPARSLFPDVFCDSNNNVIAQNVSCAENIHCDDCDQENQRCRRCESGYFMMNANIDIDECLSCSDIPNCHFCANQQGCQQCLPSNIPREKNACGVNVCEVTGTPNPIAAPTNSPTITPTDEPTNAPTDQPTSSPTGAPSAAPTMVPTSSPVVSPTPFNSENIQIISGTVNDLYRGTDCDSFLDRVEDGGRFCWNAFDKCMNKTEVKERFCGLCDEGAVSETSPGAVDSLTYPFEDETIRVLNIYRCCQSSKAGLLDLNTKVVEITNPASGLIETLYLLYRNPGRVAEAVQLFMEAPSM